MAFAPRDFENLFEVQGLRRADDVPKRVAFQIVDSILNRGDVACRVIESAIALSNNRRLVRQLRDVAKENDDRAFANFGDLGLQQSLDYASQLVVVKTFTALDVVVNVEQIVDMFEILHRKRDALVPDIGVFLVARLKLHQLL